MSRRGWIWAAVCVAMLAAMGFIAQSAFGPATIVVGSTAYEGSHIMNAAPARLYSLTVNYHTAAFRVIQIFDGTVVPGDGAVTGCAKNAHVTGCLAWCFEGDTQAGGATESFGAKDFTVHGLAFQFGIVVVASTSVSGCFTKAIDGANEAFYAQIEQ